MVSRPTETPWPGFFEWQAGGASLAVTGARRRRYAYALLRCGTPQDLTAHPEHRPRRTLGLRKQDGRWTVAHEHHWFADNTGDTG